MEPFVLSRRIAQPERYSLFLSFDSHFNSLINHNVAQIDISLHFYTLFLQDGCLESQDLYDTADAKLKAILEASNFNPCRERRNNQVQTLHDGYRIDLIYGMSNALDKAYKMISDYEYLGYSDCRTLSPDEALGLDPFLAQFCETHSETTTDGIRVWKSDVVALWRPGGCINTPTFLPLFHDYLKNVMGKYTNDTGVIKDCFQFKLQRCVEKVTYQSSDIDSSTRIINGLKFLGHEGVKYNKHAYSESQYVFCPGELVGTLKRLGFAEPEYARFAGASLILRIDIPADKIASYTTFNQWMEIHQDSLSVAWQARFINNQIVIGIGGTKAFYGEQQPLNDHAFAIKKAIVQLNVINQILPEFLSWALNKPTKGTQLILSDVSELESRGIARRWVGSRAVAYDGFPTLGPVYNEQKIVGNARCTTHLGSGGVSFAPAVINVSRGGMFTDASKQTLANQVSIFADSKRTYR